MFRRRLARLLIVLLLQPWITCVHAHAGVSEHDPSGKVRPPHFHLRFLYSFWWQSTDVPSQRPHPATARDGGASTPDHDADAIYLPVSILHGWDEGTQSDAPVSGSLPYAGAIVNSVYFAFAPTISDPSVSSAESRHAFPVRLRTLVLRI
jgi:hypothetical protein